MSEQYWNEGQTGESGTKMTGQTETPNVQAQQETQRAYTSPYDRYRFTEPETYTTKYAGTETKKTSKKKLSTGAKIGIAAGSVAFIAAVCAIIAVCASLFGRIETSVRTGTAVTEEAIPETAEDFNLPDHANGGKLPGGEKTPGDGNILQPPELPDDASEDGTEESKTEAAAASMNTSGVIAASEAAAEDMSVVEVVRQCMPSMVAITCVTVEDYYDYFGQSYQQQVPSAGSGIIVGQTDSELLIATNNHVVEGSSDITVSFADDAAVSANVKGVDAVNDLAIVAVKLDEIEAKTKNNIRIIAIGDSQSLEVGASVVAIGNALGYGQSVSAGIISATEREVTVDKESHLLLQTDASINPGNSGGALLNMRGELIGINEIKYVSSEVEGIGYAIPMATAEPILAELGSKQAREKVEDENASYMGIVCSNVADYLVQSGYPAGVRVESVTAGGPAEQGGMRTNDFITAIGGTAVRSTNELLDELSYYPAGETVSFTVSRINEDGSGFDSLELEITLGKKTDAQTSAEENGNGNGGPGSAPAEEPPAEDNDLPEMPNFPFNWNHQG